MSVINFSYVSRDMSDCLTESLVSLVSNPKHSTHGLIKLLKKAAYLGRRLLSDKQESAVFKLTGIISFFDRTLKHVLSLEGITQEELELVC